MQSWQSSNGFGCEGSRGQFSRIQASFVADGHVEEPIGIFFFFFFFFFSLKEKIDIFFFIGLRGLKRAFGRSAFGLTATGTKSKSSLRQPC